MLASEVFPTPRSPNRIACSPFWKIVLISFSRCLFLPANRSLWSIGEPGVKEFTTCAISMYLRSSSIRPPHLLVVIFYLQVTVHSLRYFSQSLHICLDYSQNIKH